MDSHEIYVFNIHEVPVLSSIIMRYYVLNIHEV